MLREAEGLSQEALAYRAGITKNQVQLLEAGRSSGRKDSSGPSNPRMKTLDGVARALGMDVPRFLTVANDLALRSEGWYDERIDEYKDEIEDQSYLYEEGFLEREDEKN